MTLLLKQLDIHGFKSFATPTSFVFDRGITAVIGPNGSGKSNVAEALRWVLGEQGYSNLRSRRTEDVIFSGSDKRAQLSMAEVVLTLDNGDGDLPMPFAEITVTRRAFRSGESQYLINGSRVRLKDIQQLVAPLGQSYTIIGQGLVDAALSQRPEERRGLFEHAAGISGLRMRANEAERSLAESSANALRLHDILGELEPRVRSLERAARQAREYGAVRDRLLDMQRRYYGYLWEQSQARLRAMRAALREAEQAHTQHEQNHERTSRDLSTLRSQERQLADEQRSLVEAVNVTERALADARHRRALLDASLRASRERLADLKLRVEERMEERASLVEEALLHEQSAVELREQIAVTESELAQHNAIAEQARQEQAALQASLDDIDRRLVALSREEAATEGSRTSLAERISAAVSDRARFESQIASSAERLARLNLKRDELNQQAHALTVEIGVADTALAEATAQVQQIITATTEHQSTLQEIERDLAVMQTRLDALERSHASGDGLYAGVRAVLRAVNKGELKLPGLVGTLAETVEVPTNLETAIEVALGGHLQDIVVATWSDAQDAISFLKRTNAGRATFQPLDSVRAGRRPTLNLHDTDLLGVAADLVTFPESVGPVVEQLLGRTLVVSNLDASRRILKATQGWTLVTLSGEITRPSGSVTGGGRVAEAGLLARERERRSLPGQISARNTERGAILAAIDNARSTITAAEASRQARQAERDTLQARHRELLLDREQVDRSIVAIETDLAESRTRVESLLERERELSTAVEAIAMQRRELAAEQERLSAERTTYEGKLASEPVNRETATQLSVELASLRERLRTTEATMRRVREREVAAERAIQARNAEISQLTESTTTTEQERAVAETVVAELEQRLEASLAAVPPVEQRRDVLVRSLTSAERELNRAAENLREAERERDRASLNLARIEDEQVFLTERIRNDLDIQHPDELEPVENGTEAVPDEQEITRLRERLRRMSSVGEDVLEQYETESQRLNYLSSQLADVDAAAEGLRQVLAELNAKMATSFAETFREVAAAFEQTFSRLFGGGSARLVLNANDDGAAGIDIVAQPPGKRLQSLNALSGGERTLTAVALLIAIQRVNPSPFCLLDEVDAALDESNVVRFRDELRDLSGGTQYVVITHNRGTIEGADTLYGVTMGDDGISRVLSLRLEEAIEAVESYEIAEPVRI